MEGSRRAGGAGAGAPQASAGARASRHSDQHEQPCLYMETTRNGQGHLSSDGKVYIELRRNLSPDHLLAISSSNALSDLEIAVNSLLKKPTQQTSAAAPAALPIHNHSPKQMKSDSEPVTGGKRWAFKRLFRRR
ncbi:hypothetical protein BDV23DRAFT_183592 [Aspergillus alliaceus]|uniref:Uncharacterized protein n=1 Tax=Petromyces alliaceus TaxID=209559 RepID=A0A5N7C8J3_PETAA|nr:hypothetical protein BDV23DRAFT_183592 [Aspergillus alliaceus]